MIAASGTSWPGIGVCLSFAVLFGLWSLIAGMAAVQTRRSSDWFPPLMLSMFSAAMVGVAVVAARPR